jgi:acetyl esterase/lipase
VSFRTDKPSDASSVKMATSLLAQQPYKGLYTAAFLASLPIRVLAILIYFIPKPLRPNSAWTYHQAIGNRLFGIWWSFATTIEFRTPKTITPGGEKERFILISPPSTGPPPYTGIANSDPAINPCTIGGAWYASAPKPGEVLYFHGGAYVMGGVREYEGGWGPRVLSNAMACPVLLPQYRLSVEDNASFPAALQDAITAYAYLLNELKVPASEIVLAGESAGGNLVISLIRYLLEEGKAAHLPLPRAALLWSPWLDLAADPAAVDRHPRLAQDYITGSLMAWGLRRFTPKGWSTSHPYLCHLGNEFHSPVPLFVHTGTAELLYEDHVKYVEKMRANGTRVEILETPNAPHDSFGAGPILGFIKESTEAADHAARFVDGAGR